MLILPTQAPVMTAANGPISPLNAVWPGWLYRRLALPQWGHLLLVFPLGETAVSCSRITIHPARYLMLMSAVQQHAFTLEALEPQTGPARILVLWLSPAFIADMARFLNIPDNLRQLLHGVPLLHGDQMSGLLAELAAACHPPVAPAVSEDLFLEVVGEVLRLMRLRHQALLGLASYKRRTVADLLPRLLQARQYIEARYARPFKTQDVADYVALSEFHFARLFKAAFDITVRQYVIRLRLDEARRWLERPGTNVTETAFQVGYSSLSSFIHAFTRQFGVSPARYQAHMKNEQDLTSPSPPGFL